MKIIGDKSASYFPTWDPTGRRFAVSSQWMPKTLKIFDATALRQVAKIEDTHEIADSSFSRDGRRMLTSSERYVRLWDAESGALLASFEGSEADAFASSVDGARIATVSSDGNIRLWDADSGRQLALFRGHRDRIESLQFSEDGTRLLAVGKDGYATLWDVHLDPRSPDAIVDLAERGTWRFENGLLIAKPR